MNFQDFLDMNWYMNRYNFFGKRAFTGFLVALFTLTPFWGFGDTVETRDGAVLVGDITGMTDETITLETVYAGVLEIKKAEVVGFSTEEPVFVRLKGGRTLSGKVLHSGGSRMEIVDAEGSHATQMPEIAVSWVSGGEDPAVIKMRKELEEKRRKWTHEVGIDLSGKSGNSDEFGTAARLKSSLTGPVGSIGFYLSYDQAEKNGDQTSNEFIAGTTYNLFFKEKLGWFLRSEYESDEFEDIDIRVTTAGGLSYRFIEQEHHSLKVRAGASYRFERQDNGETITSPGLDFGVNHYYRFGKIGAVKTDLKFIPSVEDFSDFRFSQDTGFEFPLASGGFLKLRIGVSNFFNNNPADGKERLDTTYYTRLLFTWE